MALQELPEQTELLAPLAPLEPMVQRVLRELLAPMELLAQHLQPQRRERGQEVVV